MPLLSKPSSAAYTSLAYITIGTLTAVWSIIWWVYLRQHPPEHDTTQYWCYAFLATGLALLVIGLGVGQIGRSARHAELPPSEITSSVERATENAAARAPIVGNVNPAAPALVANGQVASAGQVAGAAPVAGVTPMAAVAPLATPAPVGPIPTGAPQRRA